MLQDASSVYDGLAVYISLSGPNPIMVQIGKALEQREKKEEPSKKENEEEEEEDKEVTEEKELDLLWKVMEMALATTYLIEESKADMSKSNSHEQKCQHDYRLNDQFGIICKICEEEAENDKQDVAEVDTRLEFVTRPASSNMFVSDDKENVGIYIP
ncbi:hypothetical protein Tco_0943113, partial [Tanacetum coccineum]